MKLKDILPQKLPWLKVDFDRIKHESETEDENEKLGVSKQDILRTKVFLPLSYWG